jgi:hypothetical protein
MDRFVPPRTRTTPLLLAVLICLCVARSAAAADSKPVHANLTAAQIVEKHIAARGGLPAWHAVQAISWTGKMDAGGGNSVARSEMYVKGPAGLADKKKLAQAVPTDDKAEDKQVQLPFTLSMERPHKSRLELQFNGKTAVQVYDGTNGWKLRPFLNRNDVEPFTADEMKSVAAKPGLDGPLLNYAAEGTKLDLEAVEPVDGHDAYKLKLTAKNGAVQHVWIDAQSFLDVKVEGSQRRMDGRMRNVWIYQRDFRSVQGVMIPFVLETAVDGYRGTHKTIIEKVTVNPKLGEGLFGKPSV